MTTLPWFRFYQETLDDPKVQRLDGATFKHWVNLLCLACRHGGKLPANADVAFALRIDEIALESLLDRLLIAGLIEVRKGGANGSYIAPHGWEKRQYKSDNSSDRVKRYRERSKDVTETPPDTDTDTDVPLSKDNGAKPDSDKEFWDASKAYLAKHGIKNPGALIGKWCRDYDQPETARAITAAQLERAAEPVSFITACLKQGGASNECLPPMYV